MTQGRAAAPELVRLGVRVRRDRADEALAALLPLLPGGAEETEPAPGEVEYAIYAPPAALPPDDAIRALAGDALCGVTRAPVEPGWARRWHEHLRPVEVAAGDRRVRIRAPWHPAAAAPAPSPPSARPPAFELVLDPGDSFGLGAHPTTRLSLELLLATEPGGPLCDWGTGSGVLAIAAARLGWAPVVAIDNDPGALAAARANAAASGVAVDVRADDLAAGDARGTPVADTVCANVPFDVHLRLAATPLSVVPVVLLVSGMLTSQADGIAAAWGRHGLRETERRVLEGWAGLRLEKS